MAGQSTIDDCPAHTAPYSSPVPSLALEFDVGHHHYGSGHLSVLHVDASSRSSGSSASRRYRQEKHWEVFCGISFSTSLDIDIPRLERIFGLPIGNDAILYQDTSIG